MDILQECKLLEFKELGDARGNLVVVEGETSIPFAIQRVFYIYNSEHDVIRGEHANRETEFVLINVAGSSKVRISNGKEEAVVVLDKPGKGLYIPKMIWKDMYDFSSDSVLLCLASTHYMGDEYIRDYDLFVEEVNKF